MGRTNLTYRNHLESFKNSLSKMRDGLRKQYQSSWDKLWEKAFKHANAADYAAKTNPGIPAIFSILVGMQHEIDQIKEEINNQN